LNAAAADVRAKDGFAIARRALDELAGLGASPSPVNIELWSAYLSGDLLELTAAIDDLKSRSVNISDAVLASLHEDHLKTAGPEKQILAMSDSIGAQLEHVTNALAVAENNTAQYGAALDGASTALATPGSESSMRKLVASLVEATNNMRERTRDLETRLAVTSNEVSTLRRNLMQVREEALTDPLTGVANRKRFDEVLEAARKNAIDTGSPLCLILCDIDHFKQVNDNWGHHTGDQIIRFIAAALTSAANEGQLVARYGGEEFAIVAPYTSLEDSLQVAERARASIESKVLRRKSTNENLGKVTASFGVALFEPDEPRWRLVERADTALYESKNAGRNRVSASAA
jgi:diguanylate cyclase